MKRFVFIGFILLATACYGYISGIAIQTEKKSQMFVFVNGKSCNKTPENFVRVKSLPGMFHVEVRVLNPYDKRWYLIRKDITVQKGFEFFYKIEFSRGIAPRFLLMRRYPVYSKYFLNPVMYNRHPVS